MKFFAAMLRRKHVLEYCVARLTVNVSSGTRAVHMRRQRDELNDASCCGADLTARSGDAQRGREVAREMLRTCSG